MHNNISYNKMKTRSQTKKEAFSVIKYNVDIDFDEASNAWRANKKQLPNCCYQYICGYVIFEGKKCNRKPSKDSEKCAIHNKKQYVT